MASCSVNYQPTTTDDLEVSALKLLQYPRPVSLTVEESLFKELKFYEICNLVFET
jgi:hypothetical protein